MGGASVREEGHCAVAAAAREQQQSWQSGSSNGSEGSMGSTEGSKGSSEAAAPVGICSAGGLLRVQSNQ